MANPETRSSEAVAEEAGLNGVSSSTSGSEEEEREWREVQQLWFDAIKLPLYSVAVNPIVVPVPDSHSSLDSCTPDRSLEQAKMFKVVPTTKKVLPADFLHVQVSAGAAYLATGSFAAGCFWNLIGGAIMVIAWLNLRCLCTFSCSFHLRIPTSVQPLLTCLYCLCSNDAYDAATGVDKTKKESIVNLTGGNPRPVLGSGHGMPSSWSFLAVARHRCCGAALWSCAWGVTRGGMLLAPPT